MTEPPKLRFACAKCGSENISGDATVFWDVKRQLWQIEARHDVDALLRRAVLKPRTIEMLKRYYAGESYAELGRQYGVNESRAWQICNAGLAALRAAA